MSQSLLTREPPWVALPDAAEDHELTPGPHNSDLSDIKEYIKCFLICGVRRIIEDNAISLVEICAPHTCFIMYS